MGWLCHELEDHVDEIVRLIDINYNSLSEKDLAYERVLINLDATWKWIRRNYVKNSADQTSENHKFCVSRIGETPVE